MKTSNKDIRKVIQWVACGISIMTPLVLLLTMLFNTALSRETMTFVMSIGFGLSICLLISSYFFEKKSL